MSYDMPMQQPEYGPDLQRNRRHQMDVTSRRFFACAQRQLGQIWAVSFGQSLVRYRDETHDDSQKLTP